MKIQMTVPTRARIERWLVGATLTCAIGHIATASAVTGVVPVGLPFNIDTFVSSDRSYDNLPSVSVATDGTAVVAWAVFGGIDNDDYILARRLAADGTPLGPIIAVDGGPGIPSREGAPVVASDPAGNFVVAWSGYGANLSGVYRLYAADGTPLTATTCVAADCSAVDAADVSMDNAGDFAVVALVERQPNIYFFHADGTAALVQALPQSSGTMMNAVSLSMNRQNGNVDAAWLQEGQIRKNFFATTSNYKVLLQRYAADGTALGTPIQQASCTQTIYISNKVYGCDIRGASVAQDDTGNSMVTWWQTSYAKGVRSSSNIYAHSYDPTGATVTGKKMISPANTATVSVAGPAIVKATAPSTFVVAWSSIDVTDPINALYSASVQGFGLNEQSIGSAVQYSTGNDTGTFMSANGAGSVLGIWLTNAGDWINSGVSGQFFQQQ